jgi:hypothetical protein
MRGLWLLIWGLRGIRTILGSDDWTLRRSPSDVWLLAGISNPEALDSTGFSLMPVSGLVMTSYHWK